ncbi:MAG: hypothetical protein JNK91_09385 [Ferruginibacter sp.]|nr:hypothetical protein [Ferruginibacter sp.]MBN8700734.1 hypothetical protein [Chitinophagales bacterium]
MKKKIIIPASLFLLGLISSATTHAQNRGSNASFKKGSVSFNAGIGSGTEYKSDYYNAGLGTKGALEFGLWQAGPGVISLGIEAGASFSNGGYYYNDYKTSTVVVAGRSAWHHGWNVRNLDTYAGLSAGIGFHQYRYSNNGKIKQDEVIPVFGGFIGASYFITPSFGLNIEAGYDITQIQGGIIIKLK